jgi:hypothetical protein
MSEKEKFYDELMEEEVQEEAHEDDGHSFFWPILLIGVGIYFLLSNLGLWPGLNWRALFSFWPLFLIFGGLNIIANQLPRPLNRVVSTGVSLVAVAVFGLLLLFGDRVPGLMGVEATDRAITEAIAYDPDGEVAQARVDVSFNSYGGEVKALEDSPNLIAGEVTHHGRLQFNTRVEGDTAVVDLDTSGGGFFSWGWFGDEGTAWDIALSPNTPLDLDLDLASGSTTLDLSELQLQALSIDAASGSNVLHLPAGDYEATYDAASGSVEIFLPASGNVTMEVDGASGGIRLHLPDTMEAQVVVEDGGSGRLNPGDRLRKVRDGNDSDEGVWETAGFEGADNQVTVILSIASGGITVDSGG